MYNVTPYLDQLLLSVSPWMFLFSGLGFGLALVITSVMFKKKLLLRHVRAWNFAAKLIYVILLVGLPTIGGLYGFVYGTQRQIHSSLEQELMPYVTKQMPAMRQYVAMHLQQYQPGQMVTARDLIEIVIKDYYYVPTSDGALEKMKAKWINDYILRRSADVLSRTLQKILLEKISLIGQSLKVKDMHGQDTGELAQFGVDVVMKLTSNTVQEVDFTQLDRNVPQIFADAIYRVIDGYFKNLYIMVTLLFLILIGVISVEIFIYRKYYLPDARFLTDPAYFTESLGAVLPASETGVQPIKRVVQEPSINQKRLAATKDGIIVLFGSYLVVILVSVMVVVAALSFEHEPIIGWWLVAVAAALGLLISVLSFFIYIFYRRRFQPACRPRNFLGALAGSLILFRLCGVSYLQGMGGSLIPSLVGVVVIWFILFSICLTGLHFILKRKPTKS